MPEKFSFCPKNNGFARVWRGGCSPSSPPGSYAYARRYALASVSHPLPTVKFLGDNALQPLIYESPKKLLLSESKLRFYFSPFVYQSSPNLVGIYGSDRSLQRRFPLADILFQSGDIRDHVGKLFEIALKIGCFIVFGPPNFFGGEPPNF